MAKPKGPTGAYTVLRSAIDHDGETYQPGAPIALTQDEATPLLGVKAIEPAAAKQGDGKPDLSARTVAELRDLAVERKVDLGQATLKADIIAALQAAEDKKD